MLSHTHTDTFHAALLDAAMDVFLERKDPLKKVVKPHAPQGDTAAEVNVGEPKVLSKRDNFFKAIKPSTRNAVIRSAAGQCEYCDPNSGRRCENRNLLEIDHLQPRALGGTNEPENLRVLCLAHNLMMAERSFGQAKIDAFRR